MYTNTFNAINAMNMNKPINDSYSVVERDDIDMGLLEPTPINEMGSQMPRIPSDMARSSNSMRASPAKTQNWQAQQPVQKTNKYERSSSSVERAEQVSCDPLTIFFMNNATTAVSSASASASSSADSTCSSIQSKTHTANGDSTFEPVDISATSITPMTTTDWANVMEPQHNHCNNSMPAEMPTHRQTQKISVSKGPKVLTKSSVNNKSPAKKLKKKQGVNELLPALSAYNFFFRDEREMLLHLVKEGRFDLSGGLSNVQCDDMDRDWSEARKQQILHNHWFRDRTARRKHRRTVKGIDFSELSKVVASRWRNLSVQGQEFYKDIATQDLDRYHRQVRAHMKMQESSSTLPMNSREAAMCL